MPEAATQHVIGSGHQPGFHHPGILAKRLALDAEATESNADPVWLVADQDVNEPEVIRYPDLDPGGRLVSRSWRLRPVVKGVPTCMRAWGPITPPPSVSGDLPRSVRNGLVSIHDALESVEGGTVADRFHAAEELLLEGFTRNRTRFVRASELPDSEAGRSVLHRVLEDPVECARRWNEGLELVPRAGRRLEIDERNPLRTEAPVWLLGEDGSRRRAGAGEVAQALSSGDPILPRAFLMTTMFRSMTGASMIHGTGAGRYERVTEYWAGEFLELRLPDIRVVSRDLRLPLEELLPPLESDPDRDELRELQHDPWDEPRTKQDWIQRIRAAPRGSRERRDLYLGMHDCMERRRGQRMRS